MRLTSRLEGAFRNDEYDESTEIPTAASISSSTADMPSEPLSDMVPEAINKSWFLIA